MNLNDVIAENGIIVAPAGTGKTESIVRLLEKDEKRVLILTHTNAGVETILKRIKKYNNITTKYDVLTIASFSTKYVSKFPSISSYKNENDNYSNIYQGMTVLLDNNHIKKIIKRTYSKVYVDEYQDCTHVQHNIIKKLSVILNYKIFGDPLQCIYNFDEPCVDFDDIIANDYKLLGEMNYPWRWNNGNKELGQWTIQVREKLKNNQSISLNNLPNGVQVFRYKDIIDIVKLSYSLLNKNDDVAILFNQKNQAKFLANRLSGTYSFQEEVACEDLKKFMYAVDNKNSNDALKEFFEIVKNSFIKASTQFKNIFLKINDDSFDFSKIRTNIELASLCNNLISKFDVNYFKQLIEYIEKNKIVKLYRKELWNVLDRVINQLCINKEKSAVNILQNIRANDSNSLRYKYKYLISRILLVKGLEFGIVVLVNPEELSKELFYVGVSRPINKLIIAIPDKNVSSLF